MENEQKNREFVKNLNRIILYGVKVLAVMMVVVIWLALADTVIHLWEQFTLSFNNIFSTESLINILGDVLAVMIGIEIFLNIIFYLTKDSINVTLVLATALTAVSRKVIILDYPHNDPLVIFGIAAIIFAVGISYYLARKNNGNSRL